MISQRIKTFLSQLPNPISLVSPFWAWVPSNLVRKQWNWGKRMPLLWSEKWEGTGTLELLVITPTSHTTKQLFPKYHPQVQFLQGMKNIIWKQQGFLPFVTEHPTILAFCIIYVGKCKPQDFPWYSSHSMKLSHSVKSSLVHRQSLLGWRPT